MNTELGKKKPKVISKKIFFTLINNVAFEKTMKNARKRRYIKLVTTAKEKNYLVSEPNYHTIKFFSR